MGSVITTDGYEVVVDDQDLILVTTGPAWKTIKPRNTRYAVRWERGKFVYMHRLIMGLDGPKVDHKDGDGLHNNRENLRHATNRENVRNSPKQSNNTSGFKGVCWDKNRRKWVVHIKSGPRQKYLGRYNDIIEAAKAYDEAARKAFGEFANTNFAAAERIA